MSSLDAAVAHHPQQVLTSQAAVALWLRFQCNPAATLHDSYREVLVTEAKPQAQATRQKSEKDESAKDKSAKDKSERVLPHDSSWLERLWGTALLSRCVCERFTLRCDSWPRGTSELPFFLRLVMLDSAVLLRLLRSAGLVLSGSAIAAEIDRASVARLKQGLGEEDYAFALTARARLRPFCDRVVSSVVLRVASEHRASLGNGAFHTVVGLRLLLLQGEGVLTEQHWQRLALKCPRGIVELLRRGSKQEHFAVAGLDEGTAAGLQARLAIFETEGEGSGIEDFWCSVAKEVVESWHAWLAFSKVA